MEYKEKNFISVVVYVRNAEHIIADFLKMMIDVLESGFEHSEIICVNDYSNDSSVARIKEIAKSAKSTSISVVNMSYFHGLELAMNAGIGLAIGDFVFEFDTISADCGSDIIMDVYRKSLEGYDIVSASPEKQNKLTSKLFYWVFDRYSNTPYKMRTESFRILSRRMINRISNMNATIPYRKAVYANCGLKSANITYKPNAIYSRTSRKERAYRKRLAIDSLLLFTEIGYRFSLTMTTLMIMFSVFMTVYSIWVYLMKNPVEGWTTTILFLSVAFGGLFGILTVIIKYLQILVDLIFKRKRFSFESIEKIT